MARRHAEREIVSGSFLRYLSIGIGLICIILSEFSSAESFHSYTNYKDVDNASKIIALQNSDARLFLKSGVYEIDNPVIINTLGDFVIHGGDQIKTVLKPNNADSPLFIVKNATRVEFSNLQLKGIAGLNSTLVRFDNKRDTEFRLLDVLIDSGNVVISGPGIYRIQASSFKNRAQTSASVLVDHPLADVIIVGGNMTSGPTFKKERLPEDIYNVWQKRGRVRIHGVGVQDTVGRADFRIDNSAGVQPHMINFVRSEGANPKFSPHLPSRLLYIPHSDNQVDIVLSASAGQWSKKTARDNALVDYNASGSLWLLGNSSHLYADALVAGSYENVDLFALANRTRKPDKLMQKKSKDAVATNVYSYAAVHGRTSMPYARFYTQVGKGTGARYLHYTPNRIPVAIGRPRLDAAMPGMLDVKRDFGAKGDGKHDDTRALQQALDSGRQIYIPEGIYKIEETLGYNHGKISSRMHTHGGWLAGAGKEKTRIIMKHGVDKPVFATEGMGYFVIQGIAFEAGRFSNNKERINSSNVSLEFNPKVEGAFATQQLSFYDCLFRGGRYAVSIGLDTGMMGSENMFIESVFEEAEYGVAIGSYNALNNIVYNSEFIDNNVTIGHVEGKNTGGTAGLINIKITRTGKADLRLVNTAGAPWYFHNVKSDTPILYTAPQSSKPFHLVVENSYFQSNNKKKNWVDTGSGGALVLIDSRASVGNIRANSNMSVFPVVQLNSSLNMPSPISLTPNVRAVSAK